nr:aminotransferase class V-fold PLP-dependent enzyme [Helcococcus sueciensis]
MKTYPLESVSLEEAIKRQYKLVDCISEEFKGSESLQAGDYGINPLRNQPITTGKVENILANFFDVEDSIFVRGSGTGAIREALASVLNPGEEILVHTSEIYSTTKTTFDMFGYKVVKADYNDIENIKKVLLSNPDIKACLIQYTRQELHDLYDMEEIIKIIKNVNSDIKIITDDNYAVMKVDKTGAELGADLSCFSLFKLLGPEGIGLVIGKKGLIDKIRSFHYSGGSQVQGPEAMESLRSLVYAPVQLALQAKQVEDICEELNNTSISEIDKAIVANAQSKVVLVKFKTPIAKEILKYSGDYGAIEYPVGSESRYEIVPMFYRLSGTMRRKNKEYEDYWIRINPMKAGKDTVIKILSKTIEKVKNVSR